MNRSQWKHHPITVMVIGTGVLLGLDAIAWALWAAWHVLPWLLALAVAVLACRRWQLHRRALTWLRSPTGPYGPTRLVQGQVVSEDAEQLRAELSRLRGTVARFEDAAGRTLEQATASYEHLQRQYGSER